MFVCNHCGVPQHFETADAFLSHVNILHNSRGNSGGFHCTVGECFRKFSGFQSFKRHILKNHVLDADGKGCVFEAPIVPSTSNSDSEAPDPENLPAVENQPQLLQADISPVQFEQSLFDAVESFAASLYAKPTLNRAHVQSVVESFTTVVNDSVLQLIRAKVMKISENCPTDKIQELNDIFDVAEGVFSCVSTEHRRLKALEEKGTLIPPKAYVIGRADGDALVDGRRSLVPVNVTGQFVPMRAVLKAFLELPGVYSKIIQNYNDLMAKTDGEISNIVQGSVWREKVARYFPGKTVFPLEVYFDDFECDNALGSHAGDHKIGALYYTISCIPSEFRSSLKNLFLAALFLSSDRNYGNYETFYPIIEELNFLAKEGIEIKLGDGPVQVHFALALLLGDNLGINSMIEMVESFRAHYFCTGCKEKNENTVRQIEENKALLRNRENYEADVRANNYSETGVKGECVWNRVYSYHVTEGVAGDPMHDLLEGVCHFDFCTIIPKFIAKGYFTLNSLNARILCFDYGCHDIGNRPPMVRQEHLEKGKLHFSAAEMMCFTTIFGLLIGDKVPEDEPGWRVYVLLKEILDIVLAPSVLEGSSDLLEVLISEHHSLLVEQFKVNLKPKHHFLIHYPGRMVRFGPPRHFWCMRYEGKHRPLKQIANATSSRRNLPYTVALKHQLQLNERLLSKEGLESEVKSGPSSKLPFHSLGRVKHLNILLQTDKVFHVPWVEMCGSKYVRNASVLVIGICKNEDVPVFAKVNFIVVESRIVLFVVQEYETVGFVEHFCSYQVRSTERWSVVMQHKLVSPVPLFARVGVDGLSYVTPKFSL